VLHDNHCDCAHVRARHTGARADRRTHPRTPCQSCATGAEGSSVHSTHHDDDLTAADLEANDRASRRREKTRNPKETKRTQQRPTRPPRTEADQAFKCGHCKQFIGAPASGGRHRNHCPNCLYSRHVDLKRPGDRKAECRSLMQPIGRIARRNGEQVLIHRCLGCGKDDPNRIAADDNPVLLMTLPLLEPAGLRLVQPDETTDEETA